jgi:uncharacterized protein (DUF1499 family)
MSDSGAYRHKRFSLIAGLGLLVALASLAALAAGAYGYREQMFDVRTALLMVNQYAAYAGAVAAALGLIAIGATLPGGNRRGFVTALLALIIGGASAGYIGYLYWKVETLPFIHDITTDLDNPPQFVAVAALPDRANAPNPPDYDGPEAALQQRYGMARGLPGYTGLEPLVVNAPADQVFDRALALIEQRGWEVVEADSESGRIEATDTSTFYRFKDDIVIRLTPSGAGTQVGTRVDMRSKSRIGRSDLGVNAARISEFLGALKTSMGG